LNIFVAGHGGMVGSAIVRHLERYSATPIITASHAELDLTNQSDVLDFFGSQKIDQVYLAAAKVGGIQANNIKPAEFIYDNLMIQANIINAAFLYGVKKLLFLGTSSIYPRSAPQPIQETSLLTGALEPTNEPYAIAKIAGIKLCESYNRQYGERTGIDYRCVMPTNLYGPGDNYHPETSHVIPGMIYRLHGAKVANAPFINLWGTGNPMREFLYVDDMASACVHVMNLDKYLYESQVPIMQSHINVGFGSDISIRNLAQLIGSTIGYHGEIRFDTTKPDGVPKKLLDSSKLNEMGWNAKVDLEAGLKKAYEDFLIYK
jgi:GDP-L-fucose synthase